MRGIVVPGAGVEPTLPESESGVLPLDDPGVGEEGIEPVDLQIKNLLHYRLCYSPVTFHSTCFVLRVSLFESEISLFSVTFEMTVGTE